MTGADGDSFTEALSLVTRSASAKPCTEAEAYDKLLRRGYDDATADAAVRRSRELGLVDDRAFARAWVADRGLKRGYGAMRLQRELWQRGISDELVGDALSLLRDRDEEKTAAELARQRYARLPAGLSADQIVRRVGGFLARRGYPEGLAESVALGLIEQPSG